ncbi:2-C-methyl-D-erythritol 4-phosphate cytidylyltransferase [Methylococcus capsulatus]|jgi:2-C-methyl-D-erythritol 4-phosphate cytidylyltransferase|uniref:2-C-methyl-D-erythritol 4-phosphate cytidylyltransferase n=1 Tax=Methylococcus capsulatus TaxID=414 RepID=UPI001C528656|nr:2-C-methyl-D-erythritol 4-phosphate cytidylyltransferase [Methylococcus capsulatus]QXP91736.1 2-C-methyl-D-erythritol 4-phosphate cytidylyltransferase [Methylococcus capsulatus]
MSTDARFWIVVPAAGVGKRMGADIPKQYLDVAGKPVLQHTLERLLSVRRVTAVMVALGANDEFWPELPCSREPRVLATTGGRERADSVLSALTALAGRAADGDWVLVHDAARLCVTRDDIERLMETLEDDPVGGILALPVTDTLKTVENGTIQGSADRSRVWRALTPQMFRYRALKEALEAAARRGLTVTDEASALELAGLSPRVVEGRPDNIKITRPEDLPLAAFYLERQCFE